MTPEELDGVQRIAYEELIGIADEAKDCCACAYDAFVERLRQEFVSDEYEHVGWGLRAHPDAPCEWYLTPLIDVTKRPNTGSNEPPPPWEKVFVKRNS